MSDEKKNTYDPNDGKLEPLFGPFLGSWLHGLETCHVSSPSGCCCCCSHGGRVFGMSLLFSWCGDGEWWMWMVNGGCGWWMWMVNGGCGWWMVDVDGEWWMWMVNGGCGWWMVDVDGEWWMWMVKAGCNKIISDSNKIKKKNITGAWDALCLEPLATTV